MYRLVFQSGHYEGKRMVVRQALTVAGRDAECHLALPDDPELAPRHAQFEVRGTGTFLSPLADAGVLECNRRPVTEPVRLAHNDEIVLGTTRIVYQEIIAPQARLRPSPGLLQPSTIAIAAAILLFEFALLAFLVDWPDHLIRPEIEAQDIMRGRRIRVREVRRRKVEEARARAAESLPADRSAAAGSRTLSGPGDGLAPGAGDTAAPGSSGATDGAGTDGTAEDARQVLEEADFTPVDTNTPLVELPPVSAADPRIEDAQRKLAEATTAADFADYATAFRLLKEIHQSEPGFLPAHEEHARLLEARGDLDGARQRWNQILGIAPEDSPFRASALVERQRLDDLKTLQTELLQDPASMDLDNLARSVRIADTDIQRLPAEADVDEMRVLTATLQLAPAGQLFRNAVLQVFVTFYDKAPGDAPPRPTTLAITTPPSPQVLDAPFTGGKTATVEARYVVPRARRLQEARETGEEYTFYGYTIHVFAGRILQDAFGKPRKLLDRPIHFPSPQE